METRRRDEQTHACTRACQISTAQTHPLRGSIPVELVAQHLREAALYPSQVSPSARLPGNPTILQSSRQAPPRTTWSRVPIRAEAQLMQPPARRQTRVCDGSARIKRGNAQSRLGKSPCTEVSPQHAIYCTPSCMVSRTVWLQRCRNKHNMHFVLGQLLIYLGRGNLFFLFYYKFLLFHHISCICNLLY